MSAWNNDHTRFEADVYELEVIGKLPKTLHGAFYRVQPDHAFPPMFGDEEVPLNGDGNVASFYIKDGHVDFKNRFVRTPKFQTERAARQALLGRYRNKFTDDPRVQNILTRTTANTHVIYHANKLMVLKEDARPFELDAETLDTLGIVDYQGTFRCPTHTAHPKADSTTGELVGFGYEAKGEASPDIYSFTVDKHGRVTEEVWFKAPWACMIHDFWVTDNYVVFPINGLKASLEQMKKGGEHFYYDDNLDYQLLGARQNLRMPSGLRRRADVTRTPSTATKKTGSWFWTLMSGPTATSPSFLIAKVRSSSPTQPPSGHQCSGTVSTPKAAPTR